MASRKRENGEAPRRRGRLSALVLLACAASAAGVARPERGDAASGSPGGGQARPEEGPAAGTCAPPAWTRLRYVARKALVLSAHLELVAQGAAAQHFADELRRCPEECGVSSLEPAGACLVRVSAEADLPFTERRQQRWWIDAETTAVLQVEEHRRRRRVRVRRFARGAHHDWRREPRRGEAGRPPSEWSDVRREHVDWPATAEGLPPLDATALLYLAAHLRLDRAGARHEAIIWSRDRPWVLVLEARELVFEHVDVEVRIGDGAFRREHGRRALRRAVLSARPPEALASAPEPADGSAEIDLLGMRGTVDLLLDPATGVPVELRGRAPGLGRLRVRLVEAELPALRLSDGASR